MNRPAITPELRQWIVDQARAGCPPESVLQAMRNSGWPEDTAVQAMESVLRAHLRVPAPAESPGIGPGSPVPEPNLQGQAAWLDAGDRRVAVLSALARPRVIVFGGLLSDAECDALVEQAKPRLARSETVRHDDGGSEVNAARTSQGMFFERGESAVVRRVEARIARLLQELRAAPLLPGQDPITRPLIPLADGTLLINAPSEPSVGLALQAECPSADRIDLLCAFIKWSGLRLLQESLAAHLAAGRSLRVLTTVYMGATDRRALDWLVARGAQLRVSTDTRRTRLHAKAWLFHRASGTSTAYIGSSNLSSAALLDGLEWNVRLAALETPAMLAKFQSTFEAYWEEGEFEPYAATPEEQARIDHQLARARGDDDASSSAAIAWFNLRPYAYQREMLDALAAERSLTTAGTTWWWPPPAPARPCSLPSMWPGCMATSPSSFLRPSRRRCC